MVKSRSETGLLAEPVLAAAVVVSSRAGVVIAAAGISKFHRRRAGFPVAGSACPVPLTARAGVFGT